MRFVPFLMSVFFFILINNLLGLLPFFPGGANVTGNTGFTLVLALCAFLMINIFAYPY
jgi:F-type H+-transporting ATPase subunit a